MSVFVWSLKGARVKRIAIAGATGYIPKRQLEVKVTKSNFQKIAQ